MSNQQLCGEPPPSTLSLETFIILKQSVKLYVTIDRLAAFGEHQVAKAVLEEKC